MWSHLVTVSLIYIANAATYSQDDAKTALYYAYGAYCDADELTSWDCKWCDYLSNFEVASDGVISGNSLQAFIGYDPDNSRIVLSFRGTANIEDWLKDFEYDQVEYPYASSVEYPYVHEGFYDSYTELLDDGLKTAIEGLLESYSGATMLVTGHSLGAAIAQIAALDMIQNTDTWGDYKIGDINVITFGSPRWATESMASYFDSIVASNWRIVNENDIVPTVPYTYMGDYDYHHTATEIHYTSDSSLEYTQCDGSGEDSDCDYIGYSVDDHLWYMDIYEDCSTSSGSSIFIDEDALGMFTTTDDENIEEKVIVKWKEGLDNVSKISLSIAVAVGWLMAFICCCCYFRTRKQLKQAQRIPDYQQMDDEI